jgi:hypothetical protein
MSYMTRLPGIPDTDEIKPGMAFFVGTGPLGKTCGDCAHRGYWRPAKDKFNPRTQLLEEKHYRTQACRKYFELSMRHGLPVKADWAACKYWEGRPEK